MASNVHTLTWIKKSIKYEQKFQKLHQLPADRITTIGIYKVCFEEEFIVGEGSEGTCVYVGLSEDGNEVAVKRMLTHICGDLAENERKILTMIKMEQSKHIVRYRYCTCKPENTCTFTYLVLELCEETLTEYVQAHNKDDLIQRAPITIREILTGLLDLHGDGKEEKFLHCNLKPSNILVDVLGHMRLADFGISRKVPEGKSTVHTNEKVSNIEYWRAAESIPDENRPRGTVIYKRKSDVQVVGMLCYYILAERQHPFGSAEYDRVKNILEDNPVGLKNLSNPVARDLVSWMLQHKIEDRPYVTEALKHPYLQSPDQQFDFLVSLGNEPEIKDRDVGFQQLINAEPQFAGWKNLIDTDVVNHMSNRRRYRDDLLDLLRFVRNTSEHYRDKETPERIQQMIGNPAKYFLEKFPMLPVVAYNILRVQPEWKDRTTLKMFF